MSTKEEANKSKGFEFCQAFMGKCCGSGQAEENVSKFDFKSCKQRMKQFFGGKDGKFDFDACRSKMEHFCKGTDEKSKDKETN
jgi:hypothetical protein